MFNNSIKSRLSVNHPQQIKFKKTISTPYLLNPISKVKMKPAASIQPVYIHHTTSTTTTNNSINNLNSDPFERHIDEQVYYRKINEKQLTFKNRQIFQQSSISVDVSSINNQCDRNTLWGVPYNLKL